MQLRTQILSVFIPLIVVPILILGVISLDKLQSNAKERLLSQLSAETQKVGLQSRAQIHSIEKDLEILSTFGVVERYLLTDDEESRYTVLLPSLLKLFRIFQETHSHYYEIKVLLNDGYEDARAALPGIENATDDESESPIFIALSTSQNPKLTQFINNPDTHTLALVAGKRMALIDRRSDPLSADKGRIGSKLPDEYRNTLQQQAGSAVVLLTNDHEKEVYLTYTTVQNRLHIIGQLDAEEVSSSGYSLTQAVLIILLISVVVTASLAYFTLNRMLIHPIRALGNAVKDLQYGEFQRKIEIQTKNELGQLARAFEDMGDKLQNSHNRIHALAYFDELTKLPNRSMFKGELQRALAYCQRHELKFGLMFIDVDNFKRVNDLLGHQGGDQLLITVAERLRASLRTEDLVASTRGERAADLV
ncbi:MAG: signal transduction protein, partial [Halothiobacillaceae bacterium]